MLIFPGLAEKYCYILDGKPQRWPGYVSDVAMILDLRRADLLADDVFEKNRVLLILM